MVVPLYKCNKAVSVNDCSEYPLKQYTVRIRCENQSNTIGCTISKEGMARLLLARGGRQARKISTSEYYQTFRDCMKSNIQTPYFHNFKLEYT